MKIMLPDPLPGISLYAEAEPFPHVRIPAISNAVAVLAAAEFPPPSDTRWHTFTGPLEEGKQEGNAAIAGPLVKAIHADLASDTFVDWLRELTGHADLVADPDRVGGGIHQSGPGARLGLHIDFSVHPQRPEFVRAVNVILYLDNCPHTETAEGWLMLFNEHGTKPIQPTPGLLVVFEANDDNYHGHPVPLAAGAPLRRSIPAYYYRPLADGEEVEAHSTRFLDA